MKIIEIKYSCKCGKTINSKPRKGTISIKQVLCCECGKIMYHEIIKEQEPTLSNEIQKIFDRERGMYENARAWEKGVIEAITNMVEIRSREAFCAVDTSLNEEFIHKQQFLKVLIDGVK